MSTKELLNIVAKRGLRLGLKEGRPVIRQPVPPGAVTDKLLAVLTRHREGIMVELSKAMGREPGCDG